MYSNINAKLIVKTSNTPYVGNFISAYTNDAIIAITAYNSNINENNLVFYGNSVENKEAYISVNDTKVAKFQLNNTTICGNILPDTYIYDIGNINKRWKNIYLSGNYIFLNDIKMHYSSNVTFINTSNDYIELHAKQFRLQNSINSKYSVLTTDNYGLPSLDIHDYNGSLIKTISLGDGTTSLLIEGSNLFYTSERVGIITQASNLHISNYILNNTYSLSQSILYTSNYILTSSNTLSDHIFHTCNFIKSTCNQVFDTFLHFINDTSNYNKNTNDKLSSSILDTSNYIVSTNSILNDIVSDSILNTSNYINYLNSNIYIDLFNNSNYFTTRISNLTTDDLINGAYNKFIENGIIPYDLTINANLVVSNLSVIGATTTINTNNYTTENLEIISETLDGPALKIIQNGILNIAEFHSNNIEVFTINNFGFVGIGISNPSDKLHIDGNIKLSGNINNVTYQELEYLSGVSNPIQTQFNDTTIIITNTSNNIVNSIINNSNYLEKSITDTSNYILDIDKKIYENTSNTSNKLQLELYHTSNLIISTIDFLSMNINNISNYFENALILSTVDASNYQNKINNDLLLSIFDTSNTLVNNYDILHEYIINTCNYVFTTSNNCINNFNDVSNLISSNTNLLLHDVVNISNQIIINSNTLLQFIEDTSNSITNYSISTSNTILENISNFISDIYYNLSSQIIDTSSVTSYNSNLLIQAIYETSNNLSVNVDNTCNYILSEALSLSNILSNNLITTSNYILYLNETFDNTIDILSLDTMEYILSASNTLTLSIEDTSNYVLDTSNTFVLSIVDTSNYVLDTSNTLTLSIVDTSNYVLDTSNTFVLSIVDTSNYVLDTSNTFVLSIVDTSNYVLNTSNTLTLSIVDTSNYVLDTSNTLTLSIEDTSNYVLDTSNILTLSIEDTSNYVLDTSNTLAYIIKNLNADNIINGDTNRFIINNHYNSNLTINGTLTASNLNIIGTTTNISTLTYQTENLEIVSQANDGPCLKVIQNGNQDIIQIFDGSTNVMSIKDGGNIGIGNSASFAPLCVGNSTLIGSDGHMVIAKCGAIDTSRQYKLGVNTEYDFVIGDYGNTNASGTWIQQIKLAYNAPVNSLVINNSGYTGIGTTDPASALHVVGSIIANGNITAYYSDARLKTMIAPLSNSLSIVENLHGFYYIPNEKAILFGVSTNKTEIGLSAQDVNKVLPEIVSLAPFDSSNITTSNHTELVSKSGSNYLTISYERLAPVFVESIKELSKEFKYIKNDLVNFKNKIINGDMSVNQRGNSDVDRWFIETDITNGMIEKSLRKLNYIDIPYSYGIRNTICFTVKNTDIFTYIAPYQRIEGYNIADLNWGTEYGISITISGWIRTNAGNNTIVNVSIKNSDNTFIYVFCVDILRNEEWYYFDHTVPRPPIASNWNSNNDLGMTIMIGSYDISSKLSNDMWNSNASYSTSNTSNIYSKVCNYIEFTGIQLEKGTVATTFELRPYTIELLLCQRYWERLSTQLLQFIPADPECTGTNKNYCTSRLQYHTKRCIPCITSWVDNPEWYNGYIYMKGFHQITNYCFTSLVNTTPISSINGIGYCGFDINAEL